MVFGKSGTSNIPGVMTSLIADEVILSSTKKSLSASTVGARTKTDTGWLGENPQALERTLAKELGKIAP